MAQICDAVHHAQRQGVIRDRRPTFSSTPTSWPRILDSASPGSPTGSRAATIHRHRPDRRHRALHELPSRSPATLARWTPAPTSTSVLSLRAAHRSAPMTPQNPSSRPPASTASRRPAGWLHHEPPRRPRNHRRQGPRKRQAPYGTNPPQSSPPTSQAPPRTNQRVRRQRSRSAFAARIGPGAAAGVVSAVARRLSRSRCRKRARRGRQVRRDRRFRAG
jgi:hypothetical protein